MECGVKRQNERNRTQEDEYKRYPHRLRPEASKSQLLPSESSRQCYARRLASAKSEIFLSCCKPCCGDGAAPSPRRTTVEALDQSRVRNPGRVRGTAACVSTKAIMLMKSSRFSIQRRRFRWVGATTYIACGPATSYSAPDRLPPERKRKSPASGCLPKLSGKSAGPRAPETSPRRKFRLEASTGLQRLSAIAPQLG